MIERLLAAEAALTRNELETAARLFDQVAEADPRNAIAVAGLASVAQREGRPDDARTLAELALAIDPDEAAALRLLRALEAPAAPAPEPETPAAQVEPPGAPSIVVEPASDVPVARRSLLERLRRWLFGPRGD